MKLFQNILLRVAVLISSFMLPDVAFGDNIYIMNAPGYSEAGPELITAIESLGHTVTIAPDYTTLPANFTSACVDPTGYHWLCFFGIYDYSALSPQVLTFIQDGGKVYYNYEVSCCVAAADGAAAMASAITGLSITPNIEGYIALGGWTADLGNCITINGNAYRCFDGLPVANQLNANGGAGSPDFSVCTNFGFFFTGSDIPGNTLGGSLTGMGDINMWYGDGEPWSNGGTNPIDMDLVEYFFPNEFTTCHLATNGCSNVCPYQNVLGPDQDICAGSSTVLDATTAGATYLWNDNSTGPTLNVNQQGTYWVEVTLDAVTCTDTMHIEEIVVTALASADITICQGLSATISANGGTTYSWSPSAGLDDDGVQNPTASPLVTTTYTVTATQGNCSDTDDVVVTVVAADIDYQYFLTPAVCQNEGTFVISQVSGGLPPYTIELESVPVLSDVTESLPAGDYELVIADVSGCSAIETITIADESYALTMTITTVNPYCQNPGMIEVTDVQQAAGTVEYLLDFVVQPDGLFDQLNAGTFDITVRDDNGCEGQEQRTLTYDPGSVTAVINSLDPICIMPGSIEVTDIQNAAAPVVISLDGDASMNGVYLNLTEGDYTVEITDADGCEFQQNVTLDMQEPVLTAVLTTTPVLCETPGQVQAVDVTGGTEPYVILIDETAFVEGGVEVDTTLHSYHIVDMNGCETTGEFQVGYTNHTEAIFTADPYLEHVPFDVGTVNESLNADQFEWLLDGELADSVSNPSFTFLEPGEYDLRLIATDTENGCVDSMNYIIYALPPNSLYIPNAFTPDEDGVNDVFFIKGENISTEDFEFLVFNRYGDVVWRAESPDDVWTGNHRDGEYYVPTGAYSYRIMYKYLDSYEPITRTGHISVLR